MLDLWKIMTFLLASLIINICVLLSSSVVLCAKTFTSAILFVFLWELGQENFIACFYSLCNKGWMVSFLGAAFHGRQLCFLKMRKKLILWTLCSYCFSTTFSRNAPAVLLTKTPSKRFTHSSFHREVSTNEDLLTYSRLELCFAISFSFSFSTWCCFGLGKGQCGNHAAVSLTLHIHSFLVCVGLAELQPQPHVLELSLWCLLMSNCSLFFFWGGVKQALTYMAIWWGHFFLGVDLVS